jgi:hypothetical protein
MFSKRSLTNEELTRALEQARGFLALAWEDVDNGVVSPEALMPALHRIEVALNAIGYEAQVNESFTQELLEFLRESIRQRDLAVAAAAADQTLIAGLRPAERDLLTWLIGQLAGTPADKRDLLLNRLVGSVRYVRQEIESQGEESVE